MNQKRKIIEAQVEFTSFEHKEEDTFEKAIVS
jgi:hypothetical protein